MSNVIKIKICGINDKKSMLVAMSLNVDYIGLVFYKNSPRNISISKAKELKKILYNKTKIVALLVNPTNIILKEIVSEVSPDYIQLHGNETPARCFYIRKIFKTKIIKAISAKTSRSLLFKINKYKNLVDSFIIDSPKDILPGGNGKTFNWKIFDKNKLNVKWLLAGGINLSNVIRAIKKTKANGIDVSSGVEIKKGVKSINLVKAFVKKCRNI